MPATRTLAEMRAQALRYADLDGFPSVVEAADHFVNARLRELYDLLVTCRGDSFYAEEVTTTSVAGKALYTWSDFGALDFYQALAVYAERDGDAFELDTFDATEKAALLRYESAGSGWHPSEMRKRIRPTGVEVRPVPNDAAVTLTLEYIPAFQPLEDDGDSFDGVNGWERFAELGAAIDLREKEEQDATGLRARLGETVARIQQLASGRDKTRPVRRRLLQSRRRWYPW